MRAVWGAVLLGAYFTAFAAVTTQDKSVRAASPWQDDPYDVVVSFTELLVPALLALVVLRRLLRPGGPAREAQLLRAAALVAWLVAATALADWLALALRADRPLWTSTTPWLAASLVPMTLGAAAVLVLHRRAVRALPPAEGGPADWLDALPNPHVAAFLRRNFGRCVLLAAAVVSAALDAAEAVAEDRTNPLLVATLFAIGTGGLAACGIAANAAIGFAAYRDDRAVALSAGGFAMLVATALRDGLWRLLHLPGTVDSPARFAAVVFGAAAVVWAAALTWAIRRRRTSRPA